MKPLTHSAAGGSTTASGMAVPAGAPSAPVTPAGANQRSADAVAELMESVIIKGDLSKLTAQERGQYYMAVCKSVGLNPLTKPLEFITLNGRLTLYALRNCTDQLRSIYKISVADMMESERDGVYIVTCKVVNPEGRTDIAKGAVNIAKLQGEVLANAMMKAETKAKRRATLSICGLGFLDETEIEDIPDKRVNPHVVRAEDIVDVPALDDPDRILSGDPDIKPLPKKNARPIFENLQNELRKIPTVEKFQVWKHEARERVQVLPADWQDIMRGLAHERLAELRQNEQPSAGTSEVSDDVPEDLQEFLKWADALLSAVTDLSMLEPTWDFKIDPHMGKFLPPEQGDVLNVFRKHEQRLSA